MTMRLDFAVFDERGAISPNYFVPIGDSIITSQRTREDEEWQIANWIMEPYPLWIVSNSSIPLSSLNASPLGSLFLLMSSEGLRTEVSTDILLYENKEMGGSGVVFVVYPWFVHFPIRRTFRNSARRSASRCPFCTRFVKCCRSRVFGKSWTVQSF